MTGSERASHDPVDLINVQERFDGTYQTLGAGGAPPPLQGESVFGYRRRLAADLQHLSQDWCTADLRQASTAVMDAAEPEILRAAAASAADRTRGNPDGSLRTVETGNHSGHLVTTFHGPSPLAWLAPLMSPARAVKKLSREPGGPPIHIQRRTV
jgi:hypothetical protein